MISRFQNNFFSAFYVQSLVLKLFNSQISKSDIAQYIFFNFLFDCVNFLQS